MTATALRRDESLGLALALAGHAALLGWLVWQRAPAPLPPPERMTVTIAEAEAGPVSTAPQPQADPALDAGPVLGEAPPPPTPDKVTRRPDSAPQPRATRVPPAPAPPAFKTPIKPPAQAGASSFDRAFSSGIAAGNPAGKAKTPPAAQVSTQLRSSWSSLIGSRVRGPWNGCAVKGLEVEQLRAAVRFTLGNDGSVLSVDEPQMSGITPANQAQVRPFRDCAVRAIKLAAPFTGLPPEFYDEWKSRKLTFKKE